MKAFIDSVHVLETGTDTVSPHLRWLLRNAIIEHCGKDAVDIIAYHKNIPTDNWGEAIPIIKGIVINLLKHAHEAFDMMGSEQNINISIRALLIRELLDTAIHEAHHLKAASEKNMYENQELEQDEAIDIAHKKAWLTAKKLDVEIFTFGPIIDNFLEETIQAFKEDVAEKPEIWKELQIYMWEHKLAVYIPETEEALGMHAFFETQAKDIVPWLDKPIQYINETVIATEQTAVNKNTEPLQPIQQPIQPMHPSTPTSVYTGEDISEYMPIDYSQQVINKVNTPVPPVIPPTHQMHVQEQTPPNGFITVEEIQATAETVLRTLFWHVVNKCEFNIEGGYNNPQAVLEPVSIAHIKYANQLFTHMNTVDENGVRIEQTPCNGFIKGAISKTNLPMYILFLNFNGQLHKRTFIVQNPNKTDSSNNLSKWAEKVRGGSRIMMLLEDNVGVRAFITLEPGQVLGQEEYKLWEK